MPCVPLLCLCYCLSVTILCMGHVHTDKPFELDWLQMESNTICYLELIAPETIDLMQGNGFVLLCLQYFLNVPHTSHRSRSWCLSFVSAVKGNLLLQIFIHTRVFCHRTYKEEKSNGNSSCQHLDFKRQHCSCKEEEGEGEKSLNSQKTKSSVSLLLHFGRSIWEHDKVLVLVDASEIPGGWRCWPLLWIPKLAMNFTILI